MLKSNKGITLTSLVIYIIGLTVVIAIMTNFTGYFYKNVSDVTIKQSAEEQYSKFLSYITKDNNSEKLANVQVGVNNNDCIIFTFTDGSEHQYIVKNGNLYYLNMEDENEKKLVLCEDVSTSEGNVFKFINEKINIDLFISNTKFSAILSLKI